MKYKYLYSIQIVSILLFCKMGLNAQEYHPFPTQNTVWTEYYYPGGGDFNSFHNYALKDKDTIILGKHYQKLYHSYDTIFTEDKVCGALREEDKRIYYYSIDSLINLSTPIPIDTEIILYDFNLQVGDTITADQYRLRAEALVVTKIDSILIGTEFKKRYYFGWDGDIITFEEWIEGIGCRRGLLSDIGYWPTNDWNSWLICFIKDGEVLYHENGFVDCYHTNPNVVQLLKNEAKIKVYPNPGYSTMQIEFDKPEYKKLIISDLSGNKLTEYDLKDKQSLVIDRGGLTSGFYFISVYDKKGNIQTLKVLLK
ncbi:MAG: T9SS type A sorting domain-containing protein [Prolixibacteraceae bacterium]|nr:T9SS type A sorting domain-containing protein [Prolixibacteraceae bacterium]